MKRSLVASLLGIALSATTATSARAQGYVSFSNYLTFGGYGAPIYMITYTNIAWPSGSELMRAGSFFINLYYQLGKVVDPIATGTLVASTYSGSGGTGDGYYNGGTVLIPDYPSSGGQISFEVNVAGLGPYSTYGPWWCFSEVYTVSSLSTSPITPTSLEIPSFSLGQIPEPSSFALAAAGGAALWFSRRRH
jgi:hypothetical protein